MSDFAKDVLQGLSGKPKQLSARYFYDANGDRLFQEIMKMPEYYLTRSEYEILQKSRGDLLQYLPQDGFDLVELGAGDGYKTKLLLEHFLTERVDFRYVPIDISQNALDSLRADLATCLPGLEVKPVRGEYFEVLTRLREISARPKLLLFLGANIGNLDPQRAQRFLSELAEKLSPGDHLLIGFDLKKDPEMIQQAYDDPAGITARFNLNLLRRINRELGANFDLEQFKHWETYHPISGETRSYLVSRKAQSVRIDQLERTFHFQAWEAIQVELSQKYAPEEIDVLGQAAGFTLIHNYVDARQYFTDALWRR